MDQQANAKYFFMKFCFYEKQIPQAKFCYLTELYFQKFEIRNETYNSITQIALSVLSL